MRRNSGCISCSQGYCCCSLLSRCQADGKPCTMLPTSCALFQLLKGTGPDGMCVCACVCVFAAAQIQWSALIFSADRTETLMRSKWDTLAETLTNLRLQPRSVSQLQQKLMDVLMPRYYCSHKNLQNPPFFPSWRFSHLLQWSEFSNNSSSHQQLNSPFLLIFLTHRIDVINLQEFFPMGFSKNQWLFWSTTCLVKGCA